MFTGIVEEIGEVTQINERDMTVMGAKVMEDLKLGDSVSINGACLTVVSQTAKEFSVDLSPETMRRTSLGGRRPGSGVNLERALAVGDRLGGHIVQGHVDGTARVQVLEREVNPKYYDLISEFDRLTGVPVLLNTSFNLKGEPIVCTPQQAINSFLKSGMDVLAIGEFISIKQGRE